MAPINRRSFLAGLIAAPVLGAVAVKAAPATQEWPWQEYPPANVETLTARILRSLKRRKDLGLVNGAIVVSAAGYERIQQEHGLESDDCLAWLRGVPVYRRQELTAEDDYWVLESARGLLWPQ